MNKVGIAFAGTALAGTMFLFGGTVGYLVAVTHPPAVLRQIAPPSAFPTQGFPPPPASPEIARPVVPPTAPQVAAPTPAQVASPTPAAPAVNPLTVPAIGREIMSEIAKLHGFVRPQVGSSAKIDPTTVVTIFFDPRCPYCHRLYQAIDGKVPVRWIPVPVLANPEEGAKASTMILSASGDKGKAMEEAFSYVGEGATGHTSQETQAWLAGIKLTDNDRHVLQDAISAFVAVHKAQPGSIGVPSVLVPHPDGSVTMHDGYEPGDENTIISGWKQGR